MPKTYLRKRKPKIVDYDQELIGLNGIVTQEDCPVCQNPEMIVQHGKTTDGKHRHWETCPECGDSFPIVCYHCIDCSPGEPPDPPYCPKCQKTLPDTPKYWERLHPRPAMNGLSRRDNLTLICQKCEQAEALADYYDTTDKAVREKQIEAWQDY